MDYRDWFRDTFVPKAAPRTQAARGNYPALTGFHMRGPKGVPDAARLREWVETNPFVYAAVSARRSQVANADWTILSTGKKPSPDTVKTQAQITNLLESPNPDGKNNSFGALLEPVIADILTLDLGALMPLRTFGGQTSNRGPISSLRHVDGARVEFIPGWQSVKDGPRYRYYVDGQGNYIELDNSELITIVANPQSWTETGLAPLRVLYNTLQADYDTFRSVHILQKKRSPQGILLIPNADEPTIARVSTLMEQELEGRSGLGIFNLEEVHYQPLGSTNVMSQGVQWFMDLIIRRICAAFQIPPIMIGWGQDANRASSNAMLSINEDAGLVPLLKLIQGYINREIIAPFSDPNLRFAFTELIVENEGQPADVIRIRSGPGITIPTVNELREIDQLSPVYTKDDADANMKMLVNHVLFQYGSVGLVPAPLYWNLVQADLELKKAQIALADAQAKNFDAQAQTTLNPPVPPEPVTSAQPATLDSQSTQQTQPKPKAPEVGTDMDAGGSKPKRGQPRSHPFEGEFNDLWGKKKSYESELPESE